MVDGVTTTYLLDTATPLTMVLAEQTGTDPAIFYLHGFDLVAQSDGATTEYFAYDGLGSVRQVADAIGSPLLTQTFDPYGSLYARTGEERDPLRLHRRVRGHERPAVPAGALLRAVAGPLLPAGSEPAGGEPLPILL